MGGSRLLGSRGGFALPSAIVALVLVALMVVGGFSSVSQEYRIGWAPNSLPRPSMPQSTGSTRLWPPGIPRWWVLPLFQPLALTGDPRCEWEVDVRSLGSLIFLDARATVVERGDAGRGHPAHRSAGEVRTAELTPPRVDQRGNVSVRGRRRSMGRM